MRQPLREDGGHDEDDGDAQNVAGVRVQINDLNVIIVAIPDGAKEVDHVFYNSQWAQRGLRL